MTTSGAPESLDPLPSGARAKMIAIASAGLAKMPVTQVPAALRKSASFAPAKRAKLVGAQIVAAVELDEEFRRHLATQVRALAPETVAALESDSAPKASSLMEAAAVAFLIRSEGWADVVASAAAEAKSQQAARGDLVGTVDRLTAALADARGDVKATRAKLRGQLDDAKAENTQLRRALAQSRVELKEALRRTDAALDAAAERDRVAGEATRSLEAEVRRLRTAVSGLQSQHTSARRAVRGDRDAETMRLRLLLDTMMDAVAGLRRELALPPSEGLPADTVAAIEPGLGSLVAEVGRALLDDDPSLLRRLMELPRVHLIVDGYNVSKTAWPTAPLDQQRERLSAGVAALVGGKGMEATIVFDGAELLHPPVMASHRTVRILFSPPGVIADDVIRALVEAEPLGRPVVVVSTDRELATSVTKKGARSVASLALVRAMGR